MRRASVSPLAARSESGNAMQIDVERLVNDPHRSASHLDGLTLCPPPFHNAQNRCTDCSFLPHKGLGCRSAAMTGKSYKPCLYAAGLCTASSYFMKKTSSYRRRADRLRPASRGPPSPLPPAQGRSAGHRLSCCPPRHPLSARRHSF